MPCQQHPQKEKRQRLLFYCYVDEPAQQGSGAAGAGGRPGEGSQPHTYSERKWPSKGRKFFELQ